MYVTMLVHNTIGRGTFDRAHSLGRHLVRSGHTVTLFAGASARATPRHHFMNGVEVIEASDPLPARARESGLSPFDLVHRMRCVASRQCDVVHCFDHRPAVSFPGIRLARMKRAACIFDWADLWGQNGIAGERRPLARMSLGAIDHFLEQRVRRNADGLTVINSALRDHAHKHFRSPIHLLPVGASSDLIKPLPKMEMRKRFGLPEDRPIAVYTGLAPYDVAYLAEAFVRVLKQHPRALLVTSGRPFPMVDQIFKAAGYADHLLCLGMLDREALAAAMSSADVLLLPYTNRPVNLFRYPNKLGDYLSVGRPVVTNATGDLGRLVIEEKVGFAVPDTTEAFAAAIARLFADRDLAEDIGRRGRCVAENKLDWRFLATGLERFYEQVVSSRS
ncbi:MAG: glycosyltransferase family 4 protein [Chthoniobacterales bacterium]